MIKQSILIRKSSSIPYKKRYAIICFCMFSGLICSLAYPNFGAEFGGISQHQYYGLISSTAASILLLIVGLFCCLYFARTDTTFKFPIKMLLLMLIQFGLCFIGIFFFLFLGLPNKTEMKQFAITNETGKFNAALSRLQEELHCCGVDSYEDYKTFRNGVISWQVPLSCCKTKGKSVSRSNCDDPQNLTIAPPDYKTGCLTEIINISDLKKLAPSFYLFMDVTRFLVLGLTASSVILIITLISYLHLLYNRHKIYGDNLRVNSKDDNESTSTCDTSSTAISPSATSIEITDLKIDEIFSVPESDTEVNNKDKLQNSTSAKLKGQSSGSTEPPIYYNMLTLDYGRISELSLEQLPGSLSQLSHFIYGSQQQQQQQQQQQSHFHSQNNLVTNKFV